ncbi:hypothetical protein Ahy_A06g026609 [Arachis hypogaea]|uniref:Uncharacterized protein n=1 Tax=Arachis hypogaea TaxID=3818 RepID=A0A445CL22_ARAHY|nr:hypothetical protein Ahy_A06g026609 [Arachis hypogaea]
MLKQHRELSMSIQRIIENNKEARIRPSKTYQSFVAAAGGHRKLSFIEKDVRNYITREVQNKMPRKAILPINVHRCKGLLRLLCPQEFTSCNIPSKLNDYNQHEEIEHEMSHVVWNSFTKESFDKNWNDFLMKYGVGDNKTFQKSLFMDSGLSQSPLLYQDEKHTKEREHACFFLTSLLRSTAPLSNSSNKSREKESDAADFHTIIPCVTKSSIEAQFQHVYTHEKFKEVQAQFR